MKTIEVKYNADGYIESITDNCIHFEQENDSLVVNAEIATVKKVRAYIKASNNNSTVTDELTPADGVYSCVVDGDYMAKGTLYVGYELYDDNGYIERLEPLKIYIDSFVNLGGGSSDNVYVVTVKVGSVETLANGMPATVENVGTKKDMILNFGLPRGEQGIKGEKGDKGDKGDKGNQGAQGIQGVAGKDGYTPIKGVDYFTAADIASLGIDEKADKSHVDALEESILRNEENIWDLQNDKADKTELNKKADKELAFDGVIKLEKFDEEHIGSLVDGNSFVDGCAIYKVILESNKDMAILFVSRDAVYDVQGDFHGYMACEVLCNGVDSYITHYDEYSYIECEWQKVSVSQTDLNTAIGDIETSLENIIKKYGLGGDSQ